MNSVSDESPELTTRNGSSTKLRGHRKVSRGESTVTQLSRKVLLEEMSTTKL